MALSGNDSFFYSSVNNSTSVNAAVVDFSTLGLTTNRVVGYVEPYLTTTITTDGLTEGKANLYYTDARSRASISASTGISYSSTTGLISNTGVLSLTGTANRVTVSTSTGVITITAPQDIGTSSSVQFARLLNSSVLTGNMLLGTQAGSALTTGTDNILIGSTAGTSLDTGTYNVCIGDLAGQGSFPLTGGLRSIYIGPGAYPSQPNPTREIVIGGITGNGSNTCTIAALNGLYVSNLGTGLLRATSGMINLAATADYVASITGTANRVTVSASTGAITISGPQDIATSSSPQFARLLNSSIGSTNLLLGSNTGVNLTTGGGNTLIGQGAGSCITTGTYNIGIGPSTFGGLGNMTQNNGFNVAVGVNALYSCSTSAAGNIAIGYQSLANLTTGTTNIQIGNGSVNTLATGSNNVYIGPSISSSSTSVSGEGVINLFGSTVGKGANTMFINASAGLYSYIPVIAQFTFINSNPQIAVNPNFLPYYSYGTSGTGSVPYFNRGITITTNLNSTIGGYWRFQQLGIYKITVSMKQLTQTTSKTTFIGKTPTLGSASITNLGTTSWTTYNNVEYIGWNITTLITVTNLTDYYFISEYFGIAVNSWMNNNASVLIEYVSVG